MSLFFALRCVYQNFLQEVKRIYTLCAITKHSKFGKHYLKVYPHKLQYTRSVRKHKIKLTVIINITYIDWYGMKFSKIVEM